MASHRIDQVVAQKEAKPSVSRALLMERAQGGDKEAFSILFDEIGPLITRVVRRRLRDHADVEDVCQDVMLAVFKSRHTYQPTRPFEPWLFAIVRNVTAVYLQRNWQQIKGNESMSEIPEIGVYDESSLAIELRETFGQLSAHQLEALKLTKLSGLSIVEAALRAGISAGSMKVRVHRAYESVKRSILR
jgi:RNA polymerase sigma-70 factor (ECF subfamily)